MRHGGLYQAFGTRRDGKRRYWVLIYPPLGAKGCVSQESTEAWVYGAYQDYGVSLLSAALSCSCSIICPPTPGPLSSPLRLLFSGLISVYRRRPGSCSGSSRITPGRVQGPQQGKGAGTGDQGRQASSPHRSAGRLLTAAAGLLQYVLGGATGCTRAGVVLG